MTPEAKPFKEILEGLTSRDRRQKLIHIDAVGRLRRQEHADMLVDLLASPDQEVVGRVIDALGRIGNPRSLKYLLEFVVGDNVEFSDRAMQALTRFDIHASFETILRICTVERPNQVRRKLLSLLAPVKDPRVALAMNEVLGQTQDPGLLAEALGYFVQYPSADKHTVLKMLSGSGQWEVAMTANLALSRLADESARSQIKRLAKSPAHPIRQAIVTGLNKSPMNEDRELFEVFFKDQHPQIRHLAMAGLDLFAAPERATLINDWLQREKDDTVRFDLLQRAAAEKSPVFYTEFVKLLSSPNDQYKRLARQALIDMGSSALDRILSEYPKMSLVLKEQMILVLGGIGHERGRPAILEALRGKERWLRLNAIEALAQVGEHSLARRFEEMLRAEKDDWVIATLASILGRVGNRDQIPLISDCLSHRDARVRANSVESLGMLAGPECRDQLQPFLRDPNDRVRVNAAIVLWRLGDREVTGILKELIKDSNKWVRASAAFALGEIADPDAVPVLLTALVDKEEVVYKNVLEALAKIGDVRALVPLLEERERKRLPDAALDDVMERFSEHLK
ncbi:MAG TPA: HEAT repeat domain-containing protein [Candidatus Ozemobacteraceae bacterium]|nr:HEAT repeat domain-containing protein [Candidatus Ozemobacteraceae bacterium]